MNSLKIHTYTHTYTDRDRTKTEDLTLCQKSVLSSLLWQPFSIKAPESAPRVQIAFSCLSLKHTHTKHTHIHTLTHHDKAWGPFIIWMSYHQRRLCCSETLRVSANWLKEGEMFFFKYGTCSENFYFKHTWKERGSCTVEGNFIISAWWWQTSWYLWILPQNNSFVFLSGTCEDTYPSNRWGPDLKWIPAGRHFNELICIGPISLCTAVIITCAHTFMRWKSGHPIAQFRQTQRIVGLIFKLEEVKCFRFVLSAH